MTRHIERQIEHLKERILRVGTLVEEAISRSISAVINRDVSLAQRVMASDEAIDRMEAMGMPTDGTVARRFERAMRYAVSKSLGRGIRALPAEVRVFVTAA